MTADCSDLISSGKPASYLLLGMLDENDMKYARMYR